MGNLQFTASIDDAQFNKALESIENNIKGLQSSGSVFSAITETHEAIQAIDAVASAIVNVRGEFRKIEGEFAGILKSKAEANKLIEQMASIAAQSPFELKDIAGGVEQLISFGANAKTAISEIQMLGDVALGTATPIGDLAKVYGELREKSSVSAGDLSYLASKNIPIFEELATVMRINVNEVNAFADAGKIGFSEVQDAFAAMTSGSGIFEGLVQRESETLVGLITGLSNSLTGMFNEIGQQEGGILNDVVKGATTLIENYEDVIKILEILVSTYGTYRAALILTTIYQKREAILSTIQLIKGYLNLGNLLGPLTAKQIAFNAAMNANIFVLAATALAGLIGYLITYKGELSDTEKIQETFNEAAENSKKELASETGQIQLLVSQINNENLSRDERNRKLQELIDKSPEQLNALNLENIATAEGTKLINEYVEARKKQLEISELTKQLDESIKRQSDAENNKNEIGFGKKLLNFVVTGGSAWSQLNQKDQEKLNKEIVKHEKTLQNQITTNINLRLKELAVNKEIRRNTIEWYDEEIKRIQNQRKLRSTTREEAQDYERQIADLQKQRNAITGEGNKSGSSDNAPFGSLMYWNNVSKKADELLRKLNLSNKNNEPKIAALQKEKIEADKKAEEINKLIAIKSFAQTLEEKKKLYEEYNQWATQYGKASADKEYEALLQSGNSYKAYLDKEIAALEAKTANGKGSADDKTNLLKLKSESLRIFKEELDQKRTEYELFSEWAKHYGEESAKAQFKELLKEGDGYTAYLQNKINALQAKVDDKTATTDDKNNLITLKARIVADTSALDAFKKRVTEAMAEAQSQTEKLALLDKEKAALNVSDDKDGNAKSVFINEQMMEAEKQRHQELKTFLLAVAGSEQKRLEIETRYKNLREALEKESGKIKVEEYKRAAEELDKREEAELAEQQAQIAMQSGEYEGLTKFIKNTYKEQTGAILDAEKDKLRIIKEKGGEQSEEYKKQLEVVKEAEKKHKEQSLKNWAAIAGSVKALGDVLKEVGGDFGEIGGFLSELGGEFGNLQKILEKTGEEGFKPGIQDYASAVQGVVQMIGTVMAANKKRAEQEKKFAQERVAYEHQYQLALNKGIGDSYKKDGNMFMTDIEAKIKAGAKQLQDAQNKYQDAIEKLDKGRAKKGQKDAVDGQTVGKLVGQGAATGAVIGSLFGPGGTAIGAGIGAAVGAITGLFTKKKKDVFGGLLELYPELVKTGADGWKEINTDMAKALLANGQLDDNTKQLVQTALDYGDAVNQSTEQMKEGILELTGKLGDSIRDSLVSAFRSGEDAAQAFSKTVGGVIADMAAKLLFAALFKENFDKLEKDMMDSYGAMGDQTVVDDIFRFTQDTEGKPQKYAEGLEEINNMLDEMGFDNAFGKTDGGNSLSGSIQNISEETAGVLAGQMNAIRITQATNLEVNRSQLMALTEIATNSKFLKHLERLESIEKKLGTSGGDLRAAGL